LHRLGYGYGFVLIIACNAIKIARSDDERMLRIGEVTDEMRHLQEQKKEALRMRLQGEVDAKTFREVTAEIGAVHDQLAREHNRLASEAAMPELPDPSLAWEDLSAADRRALTELLVDKIVVASHPHKIDQGRQAPLHHSRQGKETQTIVCCPDAGSDLRRQANKLPTDATK
jgi:hypothetical protein